MTWVFRAPVERTSECPCVCHCFIAMEKSSCCLSDVSFVNCRTTASRFQSWHLLVLPEVVEPVARDHVLQIHEPTVVRCVVLRTQ